MCLNTDYFVTFINSLFTLQMCRAHKSCSFVRNSAANISAALVFLPYLSIYLKSSVELVHLYSLYKTLTHSQGRTIGILGNGSTKHQAIHLIWSLTLFESNKKKCLEVNKQLVWIEFHSTGLNDIWNFPSSTPWTTVYLYMWGP